MLIYMEMEVRNMDKIIYQEIEYFRRDKKWTKCDGEFVDANLQQVLDKQYVRQSMERSREEAALIYKGDELLSRGDASNALEYYRKVLEKNNKSSIKKILPNVMICMILLNRPEDAIALYGLVCKTDYESAQTAEVLALTAAAYYELKNYKQALHFGERALTLDGDNKRALDIRNKAQEKIEQAKKGCLETSKIQLIIGSGN